MTDLTLNQRFASRIAAFAVIPVLLLGSGVHIHQADAGSASPQENVYVCSHGCEHPVPGTENDVPPTHDHSNCHVCQLLAQPLTVVAVVEVPQPPEMLPAAIRVCSESAETAHFWSVQSRGPPAASPAAAA